MTDIFRKVSQSKQSAERIPKFIGIIYQMIEDPRYQDYVSWSSDGAAMLIRKPTEFAEYVLPIFFKHNNFSSFVRQLNLYSFRKKKHYPFDNAFVHGMFKRNQKGLLRYIKRKGNEKFPLSPQESTKVPFYGAHEEETSQEELIRQNSYLKKVHQDLSEHVQNVERKILDISHKNKNLEEKFEQKSQDEDIMKKVIKRLSTMYGNENIKAVLHKVIQETQVPERKNVTAEPFDIDRELEIHLSRKPILEKPLRNISYSSEAATNDSRDTQKMSESSFEERFDSEQSVNEKSPLDDIMGALEPKRVNTNYSMGGLEPKRVNTNYSNWSYYRLANPKKTAAPSSNDFQEVFFDGNFNLFDNN